MSPKPEEVLRLRNKFVSFLIWQSIPTTLISLLYFTIIPKTSFSSFPPFLFLRLLFSVSISLIASPSPHPIFRPRFLLFLVFTVFSWSASLLCLLGFNLDDDVGRRIVFRGFIVGALYGVLYVLNRRWVYVLDFPSVQRPPFLNYKIRIPKIVDVAYKFSVVGSVFSAIVAIIIPHKCSIASWNFVAEQMLFFLANFVIFFSSESTHVLYRALYTKRSVFAPPKGSAFAVTNPSELLLSALEESNPTSLLRYHAYLDLCMVSENNADAWRRAAFFEETGETYRRVIAVCLRPLEQLASRLAEDLGNSADKPTNLSSPTDVKHIEELDYFQPYAWCSRIVASLTARSRKEDKFGVARLSGSNADVVSTLISCLLAVENFMGKKTNLQPPNQLGSTRIKFVTANSRRFACIKWATANSRRFDIATFVERKNRAVNSKAYAIADVLKTSIYQIVSAFQDEMLSGTKSSRLEKDWITCKKPPFGTREMLIQKLRLFYDFQAT